MEKTIGKKGIKNGHKNGHKTGIKLGIKWENREMGNNI
jgi:hypothetical protein